MNWKEFLKPNRIKLTLFFFLALLTLVLFGVMLVAGVEEKIPSLAVLLMLAGWIMIAPFAVVSITGLFLGNLLGGLVVLIVPIFMLLALIFETVCLYAISCFLIYLKNKIKK